MFISKCAVVSIFFNSAANIALPRARCQGRPSAAMTAADYPERKDPSRIMGESVAHNCKPCKTTGPFAATTLEVVDAELGVTDYANDLKSRL